MSQSDANNNEKPPKVVPSQVGRKLKKVNLGRLQKRLENVLDYHSKELWKICKYQELNKDQSAAVCNYLKLLKDLKKQEEEKLEHLSDEELEKLAAKNASK